MQVSILNQYISDFNKALKQGWKSGLEPLYKTVTIFQAHWPADSTAELATCLDKSIQHPTDRTFWKAHAYEPKTAILKLAAFNPEMILFALSALFDESKDLGIRFQNFNLYLDDCLSEYKSENNNIYFPSHYHEDYRMTSLYTCLKHPETHGYFEENKYLTTLKKLNSRDIGNIGEPSRFAKTLKAMIVFINKNEGLLKTHQARFNDKSQTDRKGLLGSELIRFIASH